MKTCYFNIAIIVMLVFPFFSSTPTINFSFNESEIRNYIPICTNNITCDKMYARIAETETEIIYEFMLYWETQEGSYDLAEHEHDWEFIIIYTHPNGTIEQVNYDSWHYYIGREKNPDAYNETNVLMYVDPDFHYFKPDNGIRSGNVTWQISSQRIYELTDTILYTAKTQVGFDKVLYDDPTDWKDMGWFGRYTAFDDGWKAFWVVADKKFSFVNFEDTENIFTKWL